MSKNKDPNQKHYFQIATPEDFAQTMQILCNRESPQPITIWEKGEDEDLAEIYTALEYLPNSKTIKLKPTGKLVTKITGSTKTGKQVLIRVLIEDKINYFSGGKLLFHPEDLSYSLEIKQEIYRSQQRSTFRLNASSVIPIQFKIDNQVFDAYDISIGGTSFIVPKDFIPRFEKGKSFTDCTLRFDRKNYHIPIAEVAILIPLTIDDSPSDQVKIGISFKNLPRKTEEELYIKISTEARGEEMKNKFDAILAKKPDQA